MHVLIAVALKSLLVAGVTLGVLRLTSKRSAAERSWVAHIGLLALLIIAFAPLALPGWTVEAPAGFGAAQPAPTPPAALPSAAPNASVSSVVPADDVFKRGRSLPSLSPSAAVAAVYALPAAILLFITFFALARLIALRSRAEVLVDGHWLSALAHAQRRMGFKHGTALLTSDELPSPVSWGVMRPVILLNSRAAEASGEAEAIIAHELAHVARLDWLKLLLARLATALFWFNPLVWILAREAHQLREEAADDSVLAADVADTDYAQLLVGVARHECPGLLLGAHGVAPSKSSLSRRVARVLDGRSVRGPAARSFALGVFSGGVLVAAPLAALNVAPGIPAEQSARGASPGRAAELAAGKRDEPVAADLPSIIADGVSTSVKTAASAVGYTDQAGINESEAADVRARVRRTSIERARLSIEQSRIAAERARAGARPDRRSTKARAVGVTREYVDAMRAATGRLARVSMDELTEMRAVGVTPDFARGLAAAGFPSLAPDQLVEARVVGLDGSYARALRAAGVEGGFEGFVHLRAVGMDPIFAVQARKPGVRTIGSDELMRLYNAGILETSVRAHQTGSSSATR